VSNRDIFARIARRYDLINKFLSLGRDQAWRREGVAHLPSGRVLDLGSGTGAAAAVFAGRQVVALDPSAQMLGLNPIPWRVAAYGERLPFATGSFEGVFSAFVVRNLTSLPETLREVGRVLRPGGAAVFVDLGRPRGRLARGLHRLGTLLVLPLVGLLFGALREYWYLHKSLDKLPPPEMLYSDKGVSHLEVEKVWRMGPLGFVYGVVLRKV